jgi:hypothetical protein
VFPVLVYISFIHVPRPAIGFGDPTAAPTEVPIADPTQPTPLPPGTVICSQGCVLQSSEPAEIYYGYLLHNLTMPERYFRLTFDIKATALATDHVVMSVLALHDGNGHQVLGLYTTESVNLWLTYRGSVVESGGPKLLINYMTEWTTVYVTYLDGMIYFATSFDSGDVFPYDVADYDGPLLSLGGVWQLYASADDPSSGGFVKDITIEGDTLPLLHSFSKTVGNLFSVNSSWQPERRTLFSAHRGAHFRSPRHGQLRSGLRTADWSGDSDCAESAVVPHDAADPALLPVLQNKRSRLGCCGGAQKHV